MEAFFWACVIGIPLTLLYFFTSDTFDMLKQEFADEMEDFQLTMEIVAWLPLLMILFGIVSVLFIFYKGAWALIHLILVPFRILAEKRFK